MYQRGRGRLVHRTPPKSFPALPASTLHHLHQTLHHAQKASSTLHQPRTGCITRTREPGKPKHQAPSTQVTRNHSYARCPLPHRNTEASDGSSQRARARASTSHSASASARVRVSAAADSQRARARADFPLRAAWTAPRVTSRHRARRASCARSGARPRRRTAEEGWKGGSLRPRSAERRTIRASSQREQLSPARLRR